MFDLSTPENREAFRRAMIASDPKAMEFVQTLAMKLEVHLAYDPSSPGIFVQRNDREEGGTIVGICGGRRFLVNDCRISRLVRDWVAVEDREFKAKRALALLIFADGVLDLPICIREDLIAEGRGYSSDLIVRHLKLQEEMARTQLALDVCYETIHAARKELGLSIRETSHIPDAIRDLKAQVERTRIASSSA